MANGSIALCGEGHNNQTGGGTVHLADHEVDFTHSLTQTPRVALPVVSIQSDRNSQQLQNVCNLRKTKQSVMFQSVMFQNCKQLTVVGMTQW